MFMSRLVRDLRLLHHFPDGRRWRTVCRGAWGSFIMLAASPMPREVQTCFFIFRFYDSISKAQDLPYSPNRLPCPMICCLTTPGSHFRLGDCLCGVYTSPRNPPTPSNPASASVSSRCSGYLRSTKICRFGRLAKVNCQFVRRFGEFAG